METKRIDLNDQISSSDHNNDNLVPSKSLPYLRHQNVRSFENLFHTKENEIPNKTEKIETELLSLDEIQFNIGALASSDGGIMYPEQLSVFANEKEQLQHLRESSSKCSVFIEMIYLDLGEYKHSYYVVVHEIGWDELVRHCTKRELWRSTEIKKTRYPYWSQDDENMGIGIEVPGADHLLSFEIFSRDTLGEDFQARVDIFPYLINYYQQESGKESVVLRCDAPVSHMIQDIDPKNPARLKLHFKKHFRGTILLKLSYQHSELHGIASLRLCTSGDTPPCVHKQKSKSKHNSSRNRPEKSSSEKNNQEKSFKILGQSNVKGHMRRKTDIVKLPVRDQKPKKRFSQPKYRGDEKPEEFPLLMIVSENDIIYNLGSFFSDGAGWIYPENFSVFTKESKDQIIAIKQACNNYSITIHEIEGKDLFSNTSIDGKGNPVMIVYNVCCDSFTKFSIKQEVWKSEILKRTVNPYWNLDDINLGTIITVEDGHMLSFEVWDGETFLGRVDVLPYLLEYYKQEKGQQKLVLRCDSPINHYLPTKGRKPPRHEKSIKGTIILTLSLRKQQKGEVSLESSFM